MALPLPDGLLADSSSILVVKPSSFGDVVHTLPALAAICSAHPHLEARWVINQGWETLLQDNPYLTEVIPFPRNRLRGIATLPRFYRWGKELGKGERKRPEVVLDFQGLLRSAMITRFRRAESSIGLSDAREGSRHFYRHVVTVDRSAHAIERYLTVPQALGVPIPEAEHLQFPLPSGECPSDLELPDKFVLLHPFSRGKGKTLSDDLIVDLCQHLAPVPVVLVGQRKEGKLQKLPGNVVDLTNATSIGQLIWLMRKASYAVSVDSGPMHLAAAINGSKILGIHTWTDPRKVGPFHPQASVWKAGEIRNYKSWTDGEVAQSAVPDAKAVLDITSHIESDLGC